MKKVIAAIVTKSNRDRYFHASMSCHHANIRIVNNSRYIVTTGEKAIDMEKKPCPECWVLDGYDALNDVVASRLG